MKYKIGLLTFLISAAIYTPAFAATYSQLDATDYGPANVGAAQYLGSGLAGQFSSVTFKHGYYPGTAPTTWNLTFYECTDAPCTSIVTIWTASSTIAFTNATTTEAYDAAHFGTMTFNPAHYYKMIFDSGSPAVDNIQFFGSTANLYLNGSSETNSSLADLYFDLETTAGSVSFSNLAPYSTIVHTTNTTFSGTYTLSDASCTVHPSPCTLQLWIIDPNVTTATTTVQSDILAGTNTFSFSYSTPVIGGYLYKMKIIDASQGELQGSSLAYFTVDSNTPGAIAGIASQIGTTTSSFIGATSTVDELVAQAGFTYASTSGDYLNPDTWTNMAYNTALKLFAILFVPQQMYVSSFQDSVIALKQVFPFNIFFGFTTIVKNGSQTAITNHDISTSAIGIFPATTWVGSTTLSDMFGTSATDAYFIFMQNMIWLTLGMKIFFTIA